MLMMKNKTRRGAGVMRLVYIVQYICMENPIKSTPSLNFQSINVIAVVDKVKFKNNL